MKKASVSPAGVIRSHLKLKIVNRDLSRKERSNRAHGGFTSGIKRVNIHLSANIWKCKSPVLPQKIHLSSYRFAMYYYVLIITLIMLQSHRFLILVHGERFSTVQKSVTEKVKTDSVEFADIDGDGDLDYFSQMYQLKVIGQGAAAEYIQEYDTFGWHENIDGQGTFKTLQHVISKDCGNVDPSTNHCEHRAADVNGDGYIDVIVAKWTDSTWSNPNPKLVGFFWYENDGKGTFSAQKRGPANINNKYDVNQFHLVDINVDGRIDILASIRCDSDDGKKQKDGKIVWYENTVNNGITNFTAYKTILAVADHFESYEAYITVYPIDINNDEKVDIVSTSSINKTKIVWYENTVGTGNGFSTIPKTVTNAAFPRVKSMIGADIDEDGDIDLLTVEQSCLTDDMGRFHPYYGYATCYDVGGVACANDPSKLCLGTLTAGRGTKGRLVKYEHLDGKGTFDSGIVISNVTGLQSIDIGDADGM